MNPPHRRPPQAFVRGSLRPGGPSALPLPPELAAQLSVADKVRIRDRSTIMARHLYADQGDRFADTQVGGRGRGLWGAAKYVVVWVGGRGERAVGLGGTGRGHAGVHEKGRRREQRAVTGQATFASCVSSLRSA